MVCATRVMRAKAECCRTSGRIGDCSPFLMAACLRSLPLCIASAVVQRGITSPVPVTPSCTVAVYNILFYFFLFLVVAKKL